MTDRELYTAMREMEVYYYGHDYKNDSTMKRLARLEKTTFHYKRKDLPYKRRFEELYRVYKSKNSPFYITNQKEPSLSNSQMTLLCLMETRIFGREKKGMPLEARLNDCEIAVLGASVPGTIQERFKYLSENTPISVKGVRVSKNGQTIAEFKPGYKKAPVPKSPYKKVYTPLNLEYDQRSGDYFSLIAKNSTDEILRWKDFPVYVYINSNNHDQITMSKLAIDYWSDKVPIKETSNYQTANILIDWASKGDYITVPIISRDKSNKQIKVLINMLGPTQTEPKSDLMVFLMHQIGHAIGLWGHSDDPNDIMYPVGSMGIKDINIKKKNTYFYQPIVLQSRKPEITRKDLNTLYRVYQNPTSIEKILAIW